MTTVNKKMQFTCNYDKNKLSVRKKSAKKFLIQDIIKDSANK